MEQSLSNFILSVQEISYTIYSTLLWHKLTLILLKYAVYFLMVTLTSTLLYFKWWKLRNMTLINIIYPVKRIVSVKAGELFATTVKYHMRKAISGSFSEQFVNRVMNHKFGLMACGYTLYQKTTKSEAFAEIIKIFSLLGFEEKVTQSITSKFTNQVAYSIEVDPVWDKLDVEKKRDYLKMSGASDDYIEKALSGTRNESEEITNVMSGESFTALTGLGMSLTGVNVGDLSFDRFAHKLATNRKDVNLLTNELISLAEDIGIMRSSRTQLLTKLHDMVNPMTEKLRVIGLNLASNAKYYLTDKGYNEYIELKNEMEIVKGLLNTCNTQELKNNSIVLQFNSLLGLSFQPFRDIEYYRRSQGIRPTPVGVILAGKTGVGKSTLTPKLWYDIKKYLRLTYPDSFRNASEWNLYFAQDRDDYDTNWIGQQGHWEDDIFKSKKHESHRKYITLISNVPCPSVQASLNMKGHPMEPLLVGGSLNHTTDLTQSTTINNTEALIERFPICVEVILNNSKAKDDDEKKLWEQRGYRDCTFNLNTLKDFLDPKIPKVQVNYEAVVKAIGERIKVNNDLYLASLARLVTPIEEVTIFKPELKGANITLEPKYRKMYDVDIWSLGHECSITEDRATQILNYLERLLAGDISVIQDLGDDVGKTRFNYITNLKDETGETLIERYETPLAYATHIFKPLFEFDITKKLKWLKTDQFYLYHCLFGKLNHEVITYMRLQMKENKDFTSIFFSAMDPKGDNDLSYDQVEDWLVNMDVTIKPKVVKEDLEQPNPKLEEFLVELNEKCEKVNNLYVKFKKGGFNLFITLMEVLGLDTKEYLKDHEYDAISKKLITGLQFLLPILIIAICYFMFGRKKKDREEIKETSIPENNGKRTIHRQKIDRIKEVSQKVAKFVPIEHRFGTPLKDQIIENYYEAIEDDDDKGLVYHINYMKNGTSAHSYILRDFDYIDVLKPNEKERLKEIRVLPSTWHDEDKVQRKSITIKVDYLVEEINLDHVLDKLFEQFAKANIGYYSLIVTIQPHFDVSKTENKKWMNIFSWDEKKVIPYSHLSVELVCLTMFKDGLHSPYVRRTESMNVTNMYDYLNKVTPELRETNKISDILEVMSKNHISSSRSFIAHHQRLVSFHDNSGLFIGRERAVVSENLAFTTYHGKQDAIFAKIFNEDKFSVFTVFSKNPNRDMIIWTVAKVTPHCLPGSSPYEKAVSIKKHLIPISEFNTGIETLVNLPQSQVNLPCRIILKGQTEYRCNNEIRQEEVLTLKDISVITNCELTAGDCGGLIVRTAIGEAKILGYIKAGSKSRGSEFKYYGVYLSLEDYPPDITEVMDDRWPELIYWNKVSPAAPTGEACTNIGVLAYKTTTGGEVIDNWNKMPFDFVEQLEPAALHPKDSRVNQDYLLTKRDGKKSLLLGPTEEMCKKIPSPDPELLDWCKKKILARNMIYMRDAFPPEIIDIDGIINLGLNGRKDNKHVKGLKLNAAAGIPWTFSGANKKSDLMDMDVQTGEISFKKNKVGIVLKNRVISKLKEGNNQNRLISFSNSKLKDCLVKKEQVLIGKTRVFHSIPVEKIICDRALFGDYKEIYQNCGLKLNHALGCNPHSLEWREIHDHLSKFDNVFDADYKNFDKLLHQDFHNAVNWIREEVLIANGHTFWQNARKILNEESIRTYVVDEDAVYLTDRGNKSGEFKTTMDNNDINELYTLYAWVKITGVWDYQIFRSNVREVNFGDDKLVSVSTEFKNKFNYISFKNVMQDLGHTVTPGIKTNEGKPFCNWNDLIFLKRRFAYLEGEIVAPLERRSIEASYTWSKIPLSDKVIWDVMKVESLLEACLHGKGYYEYFQRVLNNCKNPAYREDFSSVMSYDEAVNLFFRRFYE